ncbi:MAG: hypothetical protein ACTSW1_19350 [Candidatus Hodarchaeales archaeon]
MSLTKEQVTKNAKKYYSTGDKYKFTNEKLMDLLGAEFVSAPASTMKDLHGAYDGGLIEHLLTVTKYAVNLKEVVPNGNTVSMESLIKVCCLHQIGKAKLYVFNKSDWHRNNLGKMYEFNEDLVSMRIGERSIHYATSCGIEFTDDEFQAIMNYEKDGNDKQSKWHTETLGIILRMANELAIMENKTK